LERTGRSPGGEEVRVLHVHRSERADRLVEGLAELLRESPADPLAVEVVAVPAKGDTAETSYI
jgi:hypothetical protein